MRKYITTTLLTVALNIVFSSHSLAAGESKFYDDLEAGKCERVIAGSSNGNRMKKNAVTHANVWCSTGVSLGGSTNDYSAATEGTGPHWCRVKGTIQCN